MPFRKLFEPEERISIFIVEDSDTAIAMIRHSLELADGTFRLSFVKSLAEARQWLDNNTPDLAIVDLMLPDGKGTSLISPDRERAAFPVIVLTGAGNEVEAVEAIKNGALDYLVKTPEVLADLPRAVERCLREWGYISRHRLAEEALRESEERFRSIFFNAAAGMVVVSPKRRIIEVNPAFCQFTGYSAAELLNCTIDDLSHPEDGGLISGMYDDLFSLRVSALDCERRYLRKDGSDVWGHVSVACVLSVEMTPAYCIALVQDITSRKEMEEKLLMANRELDAFVHTVSHDLRSPLTPIMGYVQFILEQYEEKLDKPAMEMLREVHRQGERMLFMLEDLLRLATVGGLERPALPVKCNQVLQEVVADLVAGMNGECAPVVAGELPSLLIPKTLCAQIFGNLVGNALHYAGSGTVEVRGERIGESVRLSVRDHGPGVPDDEKSRIFELFYRGTTGSKTCGTGIGLATVQKIARHYGGYAWVEDAPGGGSIFNVELVDGGVAPSETDS
jgi:PAS domain S-box-containing protein